METFEEQDLDDFSPVVVKYARTLYDNSSKCSYDGLVKRFNRRRWSYKPERDGCVSDCVQEHISTEIDLLADCDSFLTELLVTIRTSMDQDLEMEDGHAVRDRIASVRLARKKIELVEFIIDNDILMELEESDTWTEEFLESRLKNRYTITWAFDELLQVYPQWKPRVCPYDRPNSEEQELLDAIEESSKDYYDSQDPSTIPMGKDDWDEYGYPPQASWWCPVTKCFWPGNFYHKTAHIVPAILGGRLAGYVFDFTAEDADSMVFQNPKNTLPMAEELERMFDKHQVTVMPEANGDFRFLVLDKSIISHNILMFPGQEVKLSTFHNTTLEWKNEARPSRDFLLWHFLVSLLRWRDLEASAWEADRRGILLANETKVMYSQIWSSPAGEGEEGRIRKELISAFARREGFADLPQEFYNWLSPKPSLCLYRAMASLFVSNTDDDTDMVAAEAAVVASEFLVEQRIEYRRAADWKYMDPY